ncbi:MAG: hypothetical protein Q8N10_00520 [Phenylobacterium sp.]|uniref:hypothetical protein n=1 Tax=Phenylobacterium sp. TaxID=1871053 RepID=UPI00271A7A46|nr:hypothetical protein [Phenylobacterium sp.]MDO8910935.1 hypothetical protein [Phenylobacterium sp.]MDP3098962.1 hypothetical protein [Phenylobacterium sp.]HQT52068.1 hypothetical protein [Phenylobacterium sp.]
MADWMKALLEVDPSQPDWEGQEQRAAVNRVTRLGQEVQAFEARWPALEDEAYPTPSFTWSQLERQLADLAGCPVKAGMARDLVSATRKMSRFKPPEMVLREILCMTWALLDEGFQPPPEGSAEMP